MNLVTEETIQEITDAIVKTVKPAKIILFGSYARGNAAPRSDIDLLIIEDQPFTLGRSRRKESAMLWKILSRFRIAKDILVYSREEVDKWRDTKNHVIAQALREGRVLYELR